jgi:tetratricopeptide (TPR) repeat protein
MRRRVVSFLFAAALLVPATMAAAQEDLRFFRRLHADDLHGVAVGQMEEFLVRHPAHADRGEIAWLLGRSYEALDQPTAMMRWLGEFAEGLPTDPRACEALHDAGRAGARAGLLAEAELLVDRLLQEHPDCRFHDAGILLSARIKRGRGDAAAALQLLSYLVDNTGEDELLGRALYARAALKEELEPGSGLSDLETLKASLPRHPLAGFAALQLAEHGLAGDGQEAALAELNWILDHFEAAELSARALELRARLHEADGHPSQAAADLARLAERHPERARELDSLPREVALLAGAGQGEQALSRAMAYQATVGETARSFALIGEALEADGEAERAMIAWRRASVLDPAGPIGLMALERGFRLALAADDPEALAPAAARWLARLDTADARARLLLDLGDRHLRSGRRAAARRSWARIETDAAATTLLPEALWRLARQAEDDGDWSLAAGQYDRLLREFGASARGLEARRRGEALDRYHRVDAAAAVEKLLTLLEADTTDEGSGDRDYNVGLVLLEELKEFPRAADYFDALAAKRNPEEGRAAALVMAGRAALRETERRELADDAAGAEPWRSRALSTLTAAREQGDPEIVAAAEYELTLLRLAEQPSGPDRLPILDAFLSTQGESPLAAHILYERGEVYRNTRWSDPRAALERALADHERAVALAPDGEWAHRAHLGAAQAALSLADHERAAGHFEVLVEEAAGRYEGGEARFGLGRVEEARKRFRRALNHYDGYLTVAPTSPRRPRCLIRIGDCNYFLRDWAAAEAAYDRVLLDHGDHALADDARYRLALTAEQRGDLPAARDHLDWLLDSGAPRFRREAAWRLGRRASEAGRQDAALEALRALRDLGWSGAHSAEGGLLLGDLLLERGEGAEARALYDSLLARVDLGDDRSRVRAERVRALLLDDDHAAALAEWEALGGEAVLPEELTAGVLLAFGRERAAAGANAAALSRFDTCLQHHPESGAAPWALYESALLAARQRSFDAALAGFEQLVQRYPDSEAARTGAEKAAGILFSRGEYAEASRHFEWAHERSAEPEAALLYHSALALEKKGEPRAALERVQRLLARHPEDERVPEAMMKVGYHLQALGQYERAVLAYRNAELFQDREGKARLHFWIGDCHQAMGDRDAALAAFLKVSYLYGDQAMWGVTATLRAAALYEESGDLPQARQLYEKVFDNQGPDSDFGRSAAAGLERLNAGAATKEGGGG